MKAIAHASCPEVTIVNATIREDPHPQNWWEELFERKRWVERGAGRVREELALLSLEKRVGRRGARSWLDLTPEGSRGDTVLYALCGISGSGKTTVLEATLQRAPHLGHLVTSTTRSPRPGEVPGRDYHFLSASRFATLIENGSLVCPIEYRGEWYATALADLGACIHQDTLAVLRPDKLADLAAFTPLCGIYLEMVGKAAPYADEDQIIVAHQSACCTRLSNIPGRLDQVVTTLLDLLQAPQDALVQGGLYGIQRTRSNHY